MNRDPISKQAMVKISLVKRPAAAIKRIKAALNDPRISTQEFKEMVQTASKNNFKSMLEEMRDAQFVNQAKFFQLAKVLARADRKSPLVQGVVSENDAEVNLDPLELLEQHIERLYCSYNRPLRGTVCRNLLRHEQQIKEAEGHLQITIEETRSAIARLARNKALGIDCLPDNSLHAIAKLTGEEDGFDGTQFLQERINEIFQMRVWPAYLGTARFVPLSKTDSAFPVPDNVRTIAVLPAISKLIEICILQRLEPLAYRNIFLVDNAQSGFRPGSGTEVHLVRVLKALEEITNSLNNRDDPVLPRHEGYHLVFLDLKKAYDNVDRDILVARILANGLPSLLTLMVTKWLSINSALLESGRKKIRKGVPQGGCLSPLLFNMYINPLISELRNTGVQVLAYADDIVFLAKGTPMLTTALKRAEDWCTRNSLEINRQKSGILRLRSKHTHMPQPNEMINGYPVVPIYKYLGLELKDSGIVAQAVRTRQTRAVKEKKAANRVLKFVRPTPLRSMLATSFYSSKASYALPLIAPMATSAMEEWQKLWRIKTKMTFGLCEKASSSKLTLATLAPGPNLVLRERLLRVQRKLARFSTGLHQAAQKFLEDTEALGSGSAQQMVARAANVEPKAIGIYHAMINKGLVKNLVRLRAGTLCNSRNFPQGPVYCPVDQEVLTLAHVTGSSCRLTEQWRE